MEKLRFSDFQRRESPAAPVQWFASPKTASFDYSDGAASEEYLFEVLTRASDLSETSPQLFAASQKDWPSRYHLSAERGNLLRWLPLTPAHSVLEIGAGCGAITRHLGEKGVQLTAVEGSQSRSFLAALRCRDLPNVRVFNANIQEIAPEPTFDVVTLIGVLEYAGKYIAGDAPWATFLKIAQSFLKPDGVLLIAIENKVGLKYWTGCTEDHGAGLFASLHGYPDQNPTQTFSEPELVSLCRSVGFLKTHTLYPWPDYKVPNCLLQAPQPSEALHNWIGSHFEDYSEKNQWLIHERLATQTVSEAGLLGPLSNSFLLLASPDPNSPRFSQWLPAWKAVSYAVRRAAPFWTQTALLPEHQIVEKKPLHPAPQPHSAPLQFHPQSSPWIPGNLLDFDWTRCLLNTDLHRLRPLLAEYRDFLVLTFSTGDRDAAGFPLLAPEALDCLPRNLLRNATGLQAFDLEWHWNQPIAVDLILLRALHHFTWFNRFWLAKRFQKKDPQRVCLELLQTLYPNYPLPRFQKLAQFDRFLGDWVQGTAHDSPYVAELNALFSPSTPAQKTSTTASSPPAVASGTPTVSIIIPVFNQLAHTRTCLNALFQTPSKVPFEVILIDNASSDETPLFIDSVRSKVTAIRNAENVGFVHACNQGAAAAKGEFLVFLNNDTEPLQGWLEAFLALFQQHPDAGAAGARLVYPNGTLQEAGGLIFQDGSGWNFGRGEDPLDPRFRQITEVDYCSGAALMVRKNLFEELGGFDARYAPAYYEDTDLCFAVRRRGLKVFYSPDSIVLHHEGATAGTDLSSGFKKYQALNQSKFVEKWRAALTLQDPPPTTTLRRPTTADRTQRFPSPRSTASALAPQPLAPAPPQKTPPSPPPAPVQPNAQRPPHILIIDPFFPMHDKASGSLRLFQIVMLLRAMKFRVSFLARNGGNQEVYRRQLESMGVTVYATDPEKMAQLGWLTQAPPIDLAQITADCDVAWLSFFDIAEQYLPDIRRLSPKTKILIDTVDVHFLRETREAELSGDPKTALRAQKTRDRELSIYAQADVVLTVTEADAAVLREAGLQTPTQVIPNIHETAPNSPDYANRKGLLFVGNFNHPPNIDAVQWFCEAILPHVNAHLPGVPVTIVGTNPPPEIQALASDQIRVTGWVPKTQPYVHEARVSIAPLRVGAGMKGKIGEALAHGLPVVTTPIGAEGMGLHHEREILIADQPEAFAREIVRLYQDPQLWQTLSRSGRHFIESRFGFTAVIPKLQALLAPPATRLIP